MRSGGVLQRGIVSQSVIVKSSPYILHGFVPKATANLFRNEGANDMNPAIKPCIPMIVTIASANWLFWVPLQFTLQEKTKCFSLKPPSSLPSTDFFKHISHINQHVVISIYCFPHPNKKPTLPASGARFSTSARAFWRRVKMKMEVG